MSATNKLVQAPPYPVEKAIEHLGRNLKTARLRRRMTIAEAAARLGTGVRAIMMAERGSPSTSMATYVGLLWLYNLLDQLDDVANPMLDGRGLALLPKMKRVRHEKIDNDF